MSYRIVMHIDMNAFFASVEQQANPALRGKPIAVIGRGRTVVTTASYEARARGVRTGMNTWQARRSCPEITFVQGDNRKYSHTSRRIMEMLLDYTPLVEVFSIDEAWLDLTHSLSLFGSAENIAQLIKERIRDSFGLTCSIGIAPNKLLAKLASDMKKPDGLTVISPDRVATVLERLPVIELCGIGPKVGRQLLLMGIRTCGELGRCEPERLTRRFGIMGERLGLMGRGIDESPVVAAEEEDEVKSVGHSTTLDRDITERQEMLSCLLQLSEMVGRRARRYRVAGKTVHVTVRFDDFRTIGRQTTVQRPIDLSDEIYGEAVRILDSLEIDRPVRLLGVRITNLSYRGEQLPLFDDERRKVLAASAMDAVNDRFGSFAVTFGTLIDRQEKGASVISPAWRPEGIKNVEVK